MISCWRLVQVSAAQDFLRNTALSLAAVAALQMPAAVGPDQVQLRSWACQQTESPLLWLQKQMKACSDSLTVCAGGAASSRRTPVRRASEKRAGALAELSPYQECHNQRDPGGSWNGGRGIIIHVIGVGIVTVVLDMHRMLHGVP